MKPSDLDILLQEGEGTMLEYKENLSASFARELVALANTLGGKILLGVRDDGTVAGVLFFAREPRRFFNQAYVTCILFKGTDRVHVLDRKDLAGGIVSDIEESLLFIERNTRTAYRIEGLRREDVPEYPVRALREAVTNAVMHRDWFNEGANVFVEISDDRIEISNPGGLPAGLSPAELGSRSVRRNPLVADLLHRIGFIEKAGTGIRRMREEAARHGSPEPLFKSDGFFTATFRPLATRAGEVTGEVTREVTRLLTIMKGELRSKEIQASLGLKHEEYFREAYLLPALQAHVIEMTIPEKPRSPKQRYRITALGRSLLKRQIPGS